MPDQPNTPDSEISALPETLRKGFASSDPATRYFTVGEAEKLIGNAAVRSALERLQYDDPDAKVRRKAGEVLHSSPAAIQDQVIAPPKDLRPALVEFLHGPAVEQKFEGPSPLAGDPLLDLLPDPFSWRAVPGGTLQVDGVATPMRCPPFLITTYPITFPQFQQFVDAGDGYGNDAWWRGLGERVMPLSQMWTLYDHPRENVSWFEAVAFTRWLTSRAGYDIRLPADWEWQLAAQGKEPRQYPWGDEYEVGKANFDEYGAGLNGGQALARTTAVDRYLKSASPFGVMDLVGNVWEWCLNTADPRTAPENAPDRLARGGSFADYPGAGQLTSRGKLFTPDTRKESIGFRVVAYTRLARPA